MNLIVPPTEKFGDYQIKGALHLATKQRALLLDDPGLGKTAQTIVAARSLRPKIVLSIVPPATRWGWEAEIARWAQNKYRVQVLEGRMCQIDPQANWIIVSYSLLSSPMIQRQLKNIRWSITIIDEIHWCKSTESNRRNVIFGARSNGIIKNSVYVWGLSGTLMTNTPIDLYSILKAMGNKYLHPYTNKQKFAYRYCNAYRSVFGLDTSGASNLDELHGRIFNSGLGLRRSKSEVLKQLPPVIYNLMPIEGNVVAHKAAQRWDAHVRKRDFAGALPGPGSELATARKDISVSKWGPMLDYILYKLETHEKLLVFFWHVVGIEAIELDLLTSGIPCVKYYGKMTDREKRIAKEKFTNGEARVLLANYASAGTGLDGLQYVCNQVVYYDIPWCFTEIEQTSARLHRRGQEETVNVDLPVIKGTAEQYVMKKVFQKQKYFNALLTNTKEKE